MLIRKLYLASDMQEAGLGREMRLPKLAAAKALASGPCGWVRVVGAWQLLEFVGGAAWIAVGLAKIASPAPMVIWNHQMSLSANVGLGIAEFALGVGWLLPATRKVSAVIAMFCACLFAASILLGLVDPERCACFGKIQVSKARHIFVLGVLIILSSLIVGKSDVGRARDGV